MILPCTCSHKFQDTEYGEKQRKHNFAEGTKTWRCTVCGSAKSASGRLPAHIRADEEVINTP